MAEVRVVMTLFTIGIEFFLTNLRLQWKFSPGFKTIPDPAKRN